MDNDVIEWLRSTDPAIGWQTMRDLEGLPESEWGPVRASVETTGWGAQLLALQDADGQWAGGSFFPPDFTEEAWHREGQPWTASAWSLNQLREFGLHPASASARRTVDLLGENSRWDHDGQPFWNGEVEECINARTVADGAYFGVDVTPIVDRLVGELQPDGGWNCERAEGSVASSFHTTINVLEGLLEFERATGGTQESRAARRSGEEYLLERSLFRRLSTGEPVHADFTRLIHPDRYHYSTLRALDHFRAASLHDGTAPDPRLTEAVDRLVERRGDDGRWPMDFTPKGRSWFDMESPGEPSPWITLRALRVLAWWDAGRHGS